MTFVLLQIISLLSFALLARADSEIPVPSNLTTGFVRFGNTTRQISWVYSPTNLVVYDGDVVFGTTDEFHDALINITHTSDPNSHSSRRDSTPQAFAKRAYTVFPGSSGIYPGNTVYYRYWDDIVETRHSSEVNTAIAAWKAAVPCIDFVPLANDDNPGGANGIVTITSHTQPLGYCAATVGYAKSPLWMDLESTGCGDRTMLHEFGHVLGMLHEHQRPDRGNFVKYHCNNVRGLTTCAPPGCGELDCQFLTIPGYYASTEYDINSIMHYSSDAFAKPGTLTLTDFSDNALFNPFSSLSPIDIARIRELYNCPAPNPPKCNPACNPAPGQNKCSIPSAQTCIHPSSTIGNPRAACACAAGFKATKAGIADGDTKKQWRLPAPEGNFRVWVAEEVECNTPCADNSCSEVTELSADCLHL